MILLSGNKLFAQRSRNLIAGKQFDFMLHARVVRNDDTAAGIVAEESHNGGVSAANDLGDAPFRAAGAGEVGENRELLPRPRFRLRNLPLS